MTGWDQSADLVIIGSGGGGLVAALAAKDAGLEPIVLEKQELLGGSTAMSGGIAWLPNNPLMQREGVPDSFDDAMAYFEATVGDVGPASTPQRRAAYIQEGAAMVTFLEGKGLEFVRCEGYADYYSDLPGGSARGRSIESPPWDSAVLGPWQSKIQPGMAKGIGLVVKTNEVRSLPNYNRAVRPFVISGRVWARTMLARLRRKELFTNGTALIGQLARAVFDAGIPLWTNASLEDLLVEEGRVVGAKITRDGKPLAIQARGGVLLAAGGFARNAEMRRKYSGDQPNEGRWTLANPGDTGEALETAMRLGAQTDLLDEAWWLPNAVAAELGRSTFGAARQRPGAIFVDAAGKRFCNESNSYVEVGKAMYERNKTAQAVPCWLIIDDGYRRRYAAAKSLPGKMPKEWLDKGIVKRGETLEDLARTIGVDPVGLSETVARFNTYAAKGEDPDFGRGKSAYNACLGDPGYKPNRALGPLDRAPFYAIEIYPCDVGTCGGLITDEHARVIGEGDQPIPGLYATGNITATVMGRKYLGAGASIGNSMVFGYIAARHAAGVTAGQASTGEMAGQAGASG